MNDSNKSSTKSARHHRAIDGRKLLGAGLVGTLAAAGGIVQAQSTGPAGSANDDSLTWKGITLYGTVDIGLQYDTHGAPINDYFGAGSADIVQKNSNKSVLGATPSNLSQSKIGLSGKEPIVGDWSGVFKVETFFNPQSGDITDAMKSLTQNNGVALANQSTNLDSSVDGQVFQIAYVGLSSPTLGSLTFGRQNLLVNDGVTKYDPQGGSQAFSVIGLSGTTGGAGDTQDRRQNSNLKYVVQSEGGHVGLSYTFNGASGSAGTAFQANLGADYAGASVDAYYSKIKDAIAASSLSAADVALLPGLGYSSNNSLAATVSDNTAFSIMGLYKAEATTLFAGYEHISYANPSTPVTAGYVDEGGYVLAFVNNAAYDNNKVLQVYWAGLKFAASADLDLTLAYYGYKQNSYATGAFAGCSSDAKGSCSGNLNGLSASAVYHIAKRFDGYAGLMWTEVKDGLANGYLNTSNVDPTIGLRYKF